MMASNNYDDLPLSIECVDNPAGSPGVVIYDDATVPISFHQDDAHVTASGDGPGLQSSVTVFQLDRYTNEGDITLYLDPPEIVTDSNGSLEDEVDEDE